MLHGACLLRSRLQGGGLRRGWHSSIASLLQRYAVDRLPSDAIPRDIRGISDTMV